MAGVIPVIFASSLAARLPALIAQFNRPTDGQPGRPGSSGSTTT